MPVDKPRIPRLLATNDNIELLFASDLDVEGVSLVDAMLTSRQLDARSINESIFTKIDFTGVDADKFSLSDSELKSCIFSANKFPDSHWLRVAIKSSRCVGLDMTGSIVRNVSFSDSKIEFINFRKAKLEDILFKDCMLSDVDFNQGNLKNVRFENCILKDVTFNGAKMVAVDISQSTIEHIKGIDSIKGITISQDQLIQLAPSLALAVGIKIAPL